MFLDWKNMSEVSNESTRFIFEICLKSAIKTAEQFQWLSSQWRHSGVSVFDFKPLVYNLLKMPDRL